MLKHKENINAMYKARERGGNENLDLKFNFIRRCRNAV